MDKGKFLKIITYMCLAFDKELTQEQIDIWYSFLKDYTVEELNSAVKTLVDTQKYLPTIAHIKEQIAKSKLSNVPEAEDEWQEVINVVHNFGSYREQQALECLSPYTAKIVGYIGYYRICMATPEEQVWNKKEFIAEYNALKDKDIIQMQTGNILDQRKNPVLEYEKGD